MSGTAKFILFLSLVLLASFIFHEEISALLIKPQPILEPAVKPPAPPPDNAPEPEPEAKPVIKKSITKPVDDSLARERLKEEKRLASLKKKVESTVEELKKCRKRRFECDEYLKEMDAELRKVNTRYQRHKASNGRSEPLRDIDKDYRWVMQQITATEANFKRADKDVVRLEDELAKLK